MKKDFMRTVKKAASHGMGAAIGVQVSRRFLRNVIKNPIAEGLVLTVAGAFGATASKNDYLDAFFEGFSSIGALRILQHFMPDAGLAGAEELLISQGTPQLAGVTSHPNLFADLAGNFDEIGYVEEPINGMEEIAGVFDDLGNLFDAYGNFLGNLDELGNLDDLGDIGDDDDDFDDDDLGNIDDFGNIDDLGDIGDDGDEFDDDDY
jgi:hypothetical protein